MMCWTGSLPSILIVIELSQLIRDLQQIIHSGNKYIRNKILVFNVSHDHDVIDGDSHDPNLKTISINRTSEILASLIVKLQLTLFSHWKKKEEQAQLGVPLSRIQVELGFILQAGTYRSSIFKAHN